MRTQFYFLKVQFSVLPDTLDFHLLMEDEDEEDVRYAFLADSYKELEGPDFCKDKSLDNDASMQEVTSPSGVVDITMSPLKLPLIPAIDFPSPPRELGVPRPESQKLFDKCCTCCVNRFWIILTLVVDIAILFDIAVVLGASLFPILIFVTA